MSRLLETLGGFLWPESMRAYVTFLRMTAAIFAIGIANLVFFTLVAPTLAPMLRSNPGYALVHSPAFLTVYNIFLAFAFWLIYKTRRKKRYYSLRVCFYGMFLAGAVGELVFGFLVVHARI